jgi:hypothetical protein
MSLFGLGKFVKSKEYADAKIDDQSGTITYPKFLKMKYNLFGNT